MTELKDTLSAKEFHEKTGLSLNAVYTALRKKEIPSIHIGDRYLIPRRMYEAMLSGEFKQPAQK